MFCLVSCFLCKYNSLSSAGWPYLSFMGYNYESVLLLMGHTACFIPQTAICLAIFTMCVNLVHISGVYHDNKQICMSGDVSGSHM